jgi:hypothetical protein
LIALTLCLRRRAAECNRWDGLSEKPRNDFKDMMKVRFDCKTRPPGTGSTNVKLGLVGLSDGARRERRP